MMPYDAYAVLVKEMNFRHFDSRLIVAAPLNKTMIADFFVSYNP